MLKTKNQNLHKAMKNKNDEFYTRLEDIEKELYHYRKHFKDKVVFANCDDPEQSKFYFFFKMQFDILDLKKLVTTHYRPSTLFNQEPSYKMELYKKNNKLIEKKTYLQGDGNFRSKECIEILKRSDIVCTNPPFSLFREYINQLMKFKKKFLIIGNLNALINKNIFPYIKNNQIWTGHNNPQKFINEKKEIKESNGIWYTNLDTRKWKKENQDLYKKYDPKFYPKFDYLDAINVDKVKEIPKDYDGKMGVPIRFLLNYNPQQFKVLGAITASNIYGIKKPITNGRNLLSVNKKIKFRRILIKRIK